MILAEPDCPNRRVSNRVTMVPAGSKPGTDENKTGKETDHGTEKSVAFDAKGELVAAPAGRKTVSAEPTVAPAADAATDPETTGSDVQEADDEPAPQEPAAEPDTSDDGRPAWASGNY